MSTFKIGEIAHSMCACVHLCVHTCVCVYVCVCVCVSVSGCGCGCLYVSACIHVSFSNACVYMHPFLSLLHMVYFKDGK